MNFEEMLKNMNPNMLSAVLQKMSKNLSPEQMAQVQKMLKTGNAGEVNQKLNHLSQEDFQRELQKNPALQKQLANNPEVMAKIQQIFQK